MSEPLDLEERLSRYGQVLGDELATWPTFNPATMAATSPLLLLRRWRGRWPGAGHRPLLALGAVVAIAVAVVLAIVVTTRANESSEAPSAGASSATSSDAAVAALAEEPPSGEAVATIEQDPDAETEAPAETGANDEPLAEPATEAPATEVPATEVVALSCRDGLLVNERCRIAVAVSPSARAEACAKQGGVDDGEAGCFRLVDSVASCPTGSEPTGTGCAVSSPAVPPTPTCAAESERVGESCVRTTLPTTTCVEGQLVGDVCQIEGSPAQGGVLSCPGGGPTTDGQCTVSIAGSCGTAIAVPGGCAQPAPVDKREVCPADTVLINSRCEPTGGCPTDTSSKVTSACGSPPVTELVCSATGQAVKGGECFATVAPTCPSGYRLTGMSCATETAAAPTPFRCLVGQLRIGTSCFDEQAPTSSCSEGELVGERCVVTEPASSGALTCLAGATLAGDRCLVSVDAERLCASGSLEASGCRVAIDVEEADLCDPGQTHTYGWCVQFEDPVVS